MKVRRDMKEIIIFLIQLAELFEIEEQNAGIENQRAIYVVAKLFLEEKNVSIEDVEKCIDSKSYQNMLKGKELYGLILYIKWRNTT